MTEHPKSTEVKPTTDAAAIPGPLRPLQPERQYLHRQRHQDRRISFDTQARRVIATPDSRPVSIRDT